MKRISGAVPPKEANQGAGITLPINLFHCEFEVYLDHQGTQVLNRLR